MKKESKKTFIMMLICILLVSLFPAGASAQERIMENITMPAKQLGQQETNPMVESEQTMLEGKNLQTTAVEGDYTYEVVEGSVTITKYNGTGGAVTVPTSMGELPVNKIGDYAFYNCSSLTSITLSEGLTSIGQEAFYGCSNLMNINLPQSCTSIGQQAFYGCSSFTSISLPGGLISLGVGAFSNCSSLTSITLPGTLTIINDNIFSGCSSLASISLSEGPSSIGYGAFSNCSSLTKINLPESCTSIGSYAFVYCTSLTDISLPGGLTSIGHRAFLGCDNIIRISLPESLTSIGDLAFSGCDSLKSIQFNSATTSIDDEDDGYKTIPITTTIIGYNPSTAKDYAGANGHVFQLIGAAATLQSIAITTSAAKWSYNVGEALDLSGLVVTGSYSDGTTKTETITAANVSGFNSSVAVGNQVLTITLNGKTASFTIQVIESEDPGKGEFTAFLGKDPVGIYYEYKVDDFNNSYLAYQVKPTLPLAKMYQQFVNSKCRIVALKDLTKGYMDYEVAATASLMAQIKGEAFDINIYFGSSDAKKFMETVEYVKIVDKEGNVY